MTAPHGTYAGYHAHRANSQTPCPACKKAKADRERKNRAARLERGLTQHACHTAWDSGCRCGDCTTWHRAVYRDYRERVSA